MHGTILRHCALLERSPCRKARDFRTVSSAGRGSRGAAPGTTLLRAMLGAGTVINPIIKILTTVAVLAATYLFIVRPVLDTTNEAIDKGAAQARQIRDDARRAVHDSNVQAARSRAGSYVSSLQSTWPAAAREARSCLRTAGTDGRELNRCVNFATRLVHTVQSDRSFALSYAQSLAAQGDQAGAARVAACVRDAGFETAAMQRCRNLADDLLFG